jgi:hypothetical protein
MGKKDKDKDKPRQIVNDTRGLRWLLLVCIDDLANSRITPNKANAMSNVANSIMDTMRLEMVSTRIGGFSGYEPLELAEIPKEVEAN